MQHGRPGPEAEDAAQARTVERGEEVPTGTGAAKVPLRRLFMFPASRARANKRKSEPNRYATTSYTCGYSCAPSSGDVVDVSNDAANDAARYGTPLE